MQKSRILAAAMASIALTGTLGSCSFCPDENVEPDVYGPPMPYEDPAEEPDEAVESEPAEDYFPVQNMEPAVYGPPGAF